MYRRLLFAVVFISFFWNIWSLQCYQGNSTHCKLGENTDDRVTDINYLCLKYYKCSPLFGDCDKQDLDLRGQKWEFMIADQLGCDYMKQTGYLNLTCCSTDKCNQPPAGLCSTN
ncbi:unnamed protein product [Adineta steineri]|uniref:Uncharacterized protein n=1 Tax=Adineta steineri TaxID=433720 RepID=A0A814JUW4_9BILA|nr:unnamed protein product [Adineta steineri]CAF1178956.1 unnamed protein product [Adineta steineri]